MSYNITVPYTTIFIGYKFQRPPPLPANYVCRQKLFVEMATILSHAVNSVDPILTKQH